MNTETQDGFRTRLLHAMPVGEEMTSAEVAARVGVKPRAVVPTLLALERGQVVVRTGAKKGRVVWLNRQHVMALDI